MARLATSGFELNSATADIEPVINAQFGSPTISSTQARTGTYSLRANVTGATAGFRNYLFTSNQTIKGFARIYVYFVSFPSSNSRILQFTSATNSMVAAVFFNNSNNKLQLMSADFNNTGAESAALSTGQWYCVELENDATTNPGTLKLRLDGVEVDSISNSSQGSWARVNAGILVTTIAEAYFDDYAVNDASGSSQTSYPGDAKVALIRPNAAGDVNTFATQTGGTGGSSNNYTRVDEVTPNDATDYNGSSTLNEEDMFNCESPGVVSGEVVNVVEVGFRFRNSTADATAGIKAQIIKTASGTVTQSAEIKPNSTTWKSNATAAPLTSPIILYDDPDGSDWTNTTLDSMQIGYKLVTAPGTAGRRIDVSAIWAYVDYSPATSNNYSETYTESIVLTSSLIKFPSRTISEALTVVATNPKLTSRTHSEAVTIVDTILNRAGKLLAEAVALVDTRIVQPNKNLLEAVTLVDTIIRSTSRTIQEAVTLVETLISAPIKYALILESVIVNDLILRSVGKLNSEAIVIQEQIVRSVSRLLTDVVTVVDTVLKRPNKLIENSIALTDSIVRSIGKLQSEVVTVTDTILRSVSRTIAEVVTLVDVVLKQASRTVSEIVSIADSIIRSISRTLSQTVTLSEVFTTIRTFTTTIIESITLSDTFINIGLKVRTLTETISIKEINWNKHVRVILNWVEGIPGVGAFIKAVTGSGGFSKQSQSSGNFTEDEPTTGVWERERGDSS